MSLQDDKAAARRAAFAVRKAAFVANPPGLAAQLIELLAGLRGQVLAGYMPMRTEADPLPAMAAHDGPVCVPVIEAPGLPLVFHRWTPKARMVPGAFGALIPGEGVPLVPQVLIVPLLAFDRRGFRLGYGGGFYDRTLERLRNSGPVTAIGFAFASQEVDVVPTEPTDQPLDLIVTENGCLVP